MKKLFKMVAFLCALVIFASAVACSSTQKDEKDTTAPQGDGTIVSTEQPTEAVTYDDPAIPDPVGLQFDQSIPASISVDASKHDPLPLWSSKEYTPYWDDSLEGVIEPHLLPYIIGDGNTRGCIIVCPGGGYSYLSNDNEGPVVAEYINQTWDMNAFVLQYRVTPADYHAILNDVLRAVRYVRYYAKDLGVDPNKILVMGFSAGGHLACMATEKFDYGKVGDVIDNISSRPDGAILGYPVVTLFESWRHVGSANRFLGEAQTSTVLAKFFSGEKAVREDMPPVFVMHSKKDSVVNYKNSEELANAMNAMKLSCTLKLYESGGHGFGLALNSSNDSANWKNDCLAWLKEIGMTK